MHTSLVGYSGVLERTTVYIYNDLWQTMSSQSVFLQCML